MYVICRYVHFGALHNFYYVNYNLINIGRFPSIPRAEFSSFSVIPQMGKFYLNTINGDVMKIKYFIDFSVV